MEGGRGGGGGGEEDDPCGCDPDWSVVQCQNAMFSEKKITGGHVPPKKEKEKKKGKRKKKEKRKRRIGRKRRNREEGRVAVWEGVGRVWRQVGCQEAPSKRDRAGGKKNHSLFSLPASPSATSPVFPFPRPKPPPHAHTHTRARAQSHPALSTVFLPLSSLSFSFLPSFLAFVSFFLSFTFVSRSWFCPPCHLRVG